jgi:hypothetical protein
VLVRPPEDKIARRRAFGRERLRRFRHHDRLGEKCVDVRLNAKRWNKIVAWANKHPETILSEAEADDEKAICKRIETMIDWMD